MKTYRKTSIIVGILFILGTLAGFIGAFVVLGPIVGEPVDLGKIAANGSRLSLGALLILVMGFALAMVPVLMFPIFKKHNEPLALGYLVFRGALETMAYIASVVGFLALGTLGKEFVKAGAPTLSHFQTLGALFLEGNGWISAMTSIVFSLSALMFNSLLFGSRLIPRWLSVWGFAGGILYLAEPLFFMFGITWEILFAPLALQELVMAVWLIAKGFNKSAPALSSSAQGASA
jgi:hypothetical protein